jgi:hypothetical protein
LEVTHGKHGDEDPDCVEPENEEELFETAKHLGWKPEDLRDREFAVRYAEWLEAVSPEE